MLAHVFAQTSLLPVDCTAGNSATNPSSCTPCTAGTSYQDSRGQTACITCRTCDGTSFVQEKSACTTTTNRVCECAAGYDSLDSAGTSCTACDVGGAERFKASAGGAACQACRGDCDTALSASETTACTRITNRLCECKAGYTNMDNAGLSCPPCAAGKYKLQTGNAACSTCRTCDTASTSEFSACPIAANRVCECKAGFDTPNSSAESCTACVTGKYKASPGATTYGGGPSCQDCRTCAAASTQEVSTCITTANRVCECRPGYVQLNHPIIGQATCSPCAAGKFKGAAGAANCESCIADSHYQPNTGQTQCIAVRTCVANAVTKTPGTATVDRVCECDTGFKGDAANNPSSCTAKRASSRRARCPFARSAIDDLFRKSERGFRCDVCPRNMRGGRGHEERGHDSDRPHLRVRRRVQASWLASSASWLSMCAPTALRQ